MVSVEWMGYSRTIQCNYCNNHIILIGNPTIDERDEGFSGKAQTDFGGARAVVSVHRGGGSEAPS